MQLLRVLSCFKFSPRHYSNTLNEIKMKYLNVAEKNDAAKNIASILSKGASSRREGFSPYNKIYEFNAVVMGEQSKMVMTSVSGHLLNYEFTSNYRKWEACNPVSLFDAPVIKGCNKDAEKIKRTLEREIKSCQGLIIWTDCDREGENIGYEIINVCSGAKPNLRIYRAKFSEITQQSIFRAINNLGQPNKNVSDAVDVRQELDLRTGAALTRLQTLRLRKVFPQKLADKLISYGSCQFPTLGFVVERYQAIEDFIPEPFWKIKMNHTVKELTTDFLWQRDRLFDKNACAAILDICKENSRATVEKVESKPKSKWRPLPLDTIEMEKTVSKKIKITAKETMKIAEKLYNQGYISYPRTETNIFPKDLNLTNLVEQQQEDQNWGPFARRILSEGGPNPRQGKKSDQAHPPIHPLKYTNGLAGNEKKVYEYIVRHFLACVQKDAQGFETIVTADIAGEKFIAKGLIILERNYLDVYIYEKWNAKEINAYNEGDQFEPSNLEMTESSTSPPKLLTEADLIALMDKHGIGTDATHAEHIETIKSREYVGLHENIYFVPGILGMGLVEGYNNIGLEVSLAKPVLRAEFEKDLKLICDGVKDAEEVRREQIAKYRSMFEKVVEKMRQIDESLGNRLNIQPANVPDRDIINPTVFTPVMKCPKCGNDMILKEKKDGQGKFLCCTGYPSCRNAIWLPQNVEQVEVLDQSCSQCGPDVKKLKIKFKRNVFPGEPNPNVLCLAGCDLNVLDTLDINRSNVRTSNLDRSSNSTITNTTNNARDENQRPNNNNSSFQNTTNFNRPQTNTPSTSFNNNLMPTTSYSNRTSNSYNNNNSGGGGGGGGGTSDTVACNCNKPAIELVVRKEGPNKGRTFYKCEGNQCNFFSWGLDGTPSHNNSTRATVTSNVSGDSGDPQCMCGLDAALKTVSKEGPNQGRQFYCCPKPMGEGCKFFKWKDENIGYAGGGGNDDSPRPGGKSRKPKDNNRTMPYKTKTKRKCGICHQEGHNRTNCPNN